MTIQRIVFLLRLVTLILLCLPALHLAWRWYGDDLGARPVTEATHITGDWAVVFLLASLALTPARSVFDWMPLVQIRRRIGVAAGLYAVLHFFIYVADQKWDLIVVAVEIAKRFYLTIGFIALLALVALSITSTDGWQKRLRRNWKRLHWLIYPAAVLAILHFFIQSKANVGEATVAAGPVRLADDLAFHADQAAHQISRVGSARRGRNACRLGFRTELVRADQPCRSAARPERRRRSRPRAAADAQGADERPAGDRACRGPPGRETPLDEALYPKDYTVFLISEDGEGDEKT